MRKRQAANASSRCADAATTATAASPMVSAPIRCWSATATCQRVFGLGHDAGAFGFRHRPVGGVVEAKHCTALVVIAHEADECRHAAPLRRLDGGVQRGEIDRAVGEEGHAQPPASGGRMAISSPSATGSAASA